ncbi:MAG: TetR/AcrR family transcriptional regulator [Gemmatimonadota bacterium]
MIATASARDKLLDAAVRVIRERGLAATSVDELCRAAGVTKGAFFHHFASKEALAVATAQHWSDTTSAFFSGAPYHTSPDPAQRVLNYVRFRRDMLARPVAEFTCLAGTMVQEAYSTNPAIRDACANSMLGHAATLVPDIQAAMDDRGMTAGLSAESLAAYIQASMQGAFILAKATGGHAIAEQCYDHLTQYLTLLFLTDKETAS